MTYSLGLSSLALATTFRNVQARKTKCGKWYSSDCLGDDDRRYDQDFTIDLKELAPIWGQLEGFWINEFLQDIDPNTGDTIQPQFYDPNLPVTNMNRPYALRRAFYNETFVGSRYYSNRYYMYEPASAEFCAQTPPEGFFNVIGEGTCGENGWSVAAGQFGVTTYEKDGIITGIGTMGMYSALGSTDNFNFTPVDETTYYGAAGEKEVFFNSQSYVFLRDFTQISGNQNTFIPSIPFGSPLIQTTIFQMTKVSERDWLDAIEASYEEFGVLPADRVQGGQLPMETECLEPENCPTEEDWCTKDPSCSESPYQEPDATIKAGPIVGIVVGVLVVLAVIAFWLHRRQIAKIKKRNRQAFARRIAETVRLEGSTRQLSPDALAEEFKAIDKQSKDGKISKEAMWEFVSSGKAGEMSESDFNTLWASIDIDKNGTVDFLEFCSFMGQCNDDFEKVKGRQSVLEARPSFALTAAQRLSTRMVTQPDVDTGVQSMEGGLKTVDSEDQEA